MNKKLHVRKQEQEKDEIFPKPGEKVTTDAKKFMERIKVIVGEYNFIFKKWLGFGSWVGGGGLEEVKNTVDLKIVKQYNIKPIKGLSHKLGWAFNDIKLKNQPRPLLRHSSVNFCQHFLNLSHKTVL